MFRKIKEFIYDNEASIAVEAALMTIIVFTVVFVGFEVSKSYRRQNIIHRSTATLAEIIANDNIGTATLVAHLNEPDTQNNIQELFLSMLEANEPKVEGSAAAQVESLFCIEVEYYDKGNASNPALNIITPLQFGNACPMPDNTHENQNSLPASLYEFAQANDATIPPYGKLVRLKTFFTFSSQDLIFKNFVFPTKFTSEYIAIQKRNDE